MEEVVEGSRPRPSKHLLFNNKPDGFNVDDIEGARPRYRGFKTERIVNPLDPEYPLPSVPPIVYQEPRFVRDGFDVSDIEGARARKRGFNRKSNFYDVSDIEGTRAGWKPAHKLLMERVKQQNLYRRLSQFDVTDITRPRFKSKRKVNPLDPKYTLHGTIVQDDPKYTKPKARTRERNAPFFSLFTRDISGARPQSNCENFARKDSRNPNQTTDIPGSRPGSLRRGLRSTRETNPLTPAYVYLHGANTPTPPSEKPILKQFSLPAKERKSDQDVCKSARVSSTARRPTTRRQPKSARIQVSAATQRDIDSVRNLPDF